MSIPPPSSINKLQAKSNFFSLLSFISISTKPKLSLKLSLPSFPSNRLRFLKIPPMSHPTRSPFATPQALSDWLKPRLPSDSLSTWGIKSGTKNVHNLWLELSKGEITLVDSSPPLCTVNVVMVRVFGKDEKRILIESGQELSDGSFRDRFRPLSEKMKPDETIEEAVSRAVKEELGSMVVRIVPGSYKEKLEERNSLSCPGLPARYVLHSVDAWVEGLPEGNFVTEEKEEYGDLDGNMGLEKAVFVICIEGTTKMTRNDRKFGIRRMGIWEEIGSI